MVRVPYPRYEVERAIKRIDDPDRPGCPTVDEVYDALDRINDEIIDEWDDYEDDVVYEDDEKLVLCDDSGHARSIIERDAGVDDAALQDIVWNVHTRIAPSDAYDWGVSDAIVWYRPRAYIEESCEATVMREIALRVRETGSVSRAVDTYATEVLGDSKSEWARATGRDASTVSRTTSDD